jgi:NADH:ubiquinone oxidoreductase subunit E
MEPVPIKEEKPGGKGRVPKTGNDEEIGGICSTCNQVSTCAYRLKNKGLVIWECDLYESYETPDVLEIVEKYKDKPGAVISILEEIQATYGYLPPDMLKALSEKTDYSLVDVYGAATFYKTFSLKPRGKYLVSVCLGTACHVRGGPAVAKEFERQLGIRAGETTPDKEFTLEAVNCLGACALGPVVVVEGHYFRQVNPERVEGILEKTREGLDKIEIVGDKRIFPIEVSCPKCNRSLMDVEHLIDGYPSIRVTLSFGHTHGWLRLSSLYGSYSVESEYEVPKNTVVNFFCPHCHAELRAASACPECGAPMVPMTVRGGGIILICSRRGCKGHMLDLESVDL